MQFTKSLFIALGLASASLAIVIPEGIEDGLYISAINETTGDEYWVKQADIETAKRNAIDDLEVRDVETRELHRRDAQACGTDSALDHTGCDDATILMKNYCNSGATVGAHQKVLQVSNGVAWYVCNYNSYAYYCSAGEVDIVNTQITSYCGWYVAGYWFMSGPNVNYGRDTSGASICDNL